MKKLLLFLFCLTTFVSQAEEPLVTTWEVTAGDLNITIPTNTDDYTYDYTVDFGDGTVLTNQTGNTTHTYASPGIYTVSVSGQFPHFYSKSIYNYYNENDKLKTIEQWGDNQWLNMKGAFHYCVSVTSNATDKPDLSLVSNMSEMFKRAESFNQNINNWNVSNVTDMSATFSGAINFNQPLNNWNVSNVIDMKSMFQVATNFNHSLNTWDVTNVSDMNTMFAAAADFNQPLDNWDVSNVTNMSTMFSSAHNYNQPLNNWDVSNVTNMFAMFANAYDFNQPLNNWNVSSVTNMSGMFSNVYTFNQPLDNWDVSNVTSMRSMFKEAYDFNQPLNNWNVSNVIDVALMFRSAQSFNHSLNNWNVSNVIRMNNMFQHATSFNQPLNNWNISNVEKISGMFSGATSFNQPLYNWDVSNISDSQSGFSIMFKNASAFNQNLSSWDYSNGMLSGFLDNSGISKENYDLLIDKLSNLNINNGELGAENIEYCNAFTRQQLVNEGWTITDGGQASGCDLNYVSGTLIYDVDNNGCDSNDFNLSNYLINVNNGSDDAAFDIDENGQYIIGLDSGNYTLSILNLNANFTATPPNQSINFSSQNEILDNVDFCITANQQFEDLAINIFPLEDAIPGFETDYQIIVANNGTQTVPNVQVTFDYDENFQSFDSATETPSEITANQLTFDFTDLHAFSQEVFEFTMFNAMPPTLNGGEILSSTIQVAPVVNDINPDDNIVELRVIVVNSFDPNDKFIVQGDEIVEEDINQYLDYRIRFQNLGTANALNVKITDTISDKLDWTTFQPMTSSHDYRIEIVDGEEINYYFDNINLPFETADSEGSNGYITYKIKPKPTVQIGDVIENTAYIYFDFNLPIVTNTASTTVVDELSVADFNIGEINIYPNPVNDVLHLLWATHVNLKSITLFDLNGKRVKTFKNQNTLDLSLVEAGIYMLSLQTDKGRFYKKLVKQ